MAVKAIIFDFGGVLLRTVDFTPRERLAADLNMNRLELEEFIFGGVSGDKAQKGEISVQQHWDNLRYQLGFNSQEFTDLLDKFFSADRLDEELVKYVRELHKKYKTALLSNSWSDLRGRIAQMWHIEDAFDMMIISGEVGVVKPDPKIYRLALEKLGVEAGQAIFIDDFQRNIDAAREIGMQAIRFQTTQQVRAELELLLDSRGKGLG